MAAAKLKAHFGTKAAERQIALGRSHGNALQNNCSEGVAVDKGQSRDLAAKKFNMSGVSVDRACPRSSLRGGGVHEPWPLVLFRGRQQLTAPPLRPDLDFSRVLDQFRGFGLPGAGSHRLGSVADVLRVVLRSLLAALPSRRCPTRHPRRVAKNAGSESSKGMR